MKTLIRKVKSAIWLLTHEPDPLKAIASYTSKNFKQYIVHSKQGQAFTYKTRLGFTFVCIPTLATSVEMYVKSQTYEEIELDIAAHWLQPGDDCLDLGANIGYFATLFASRVGEMGRVIAVEASPKTSEHLQQAISMLTLDQVVIEQVCITDQEGYVEFMVGCNDGLDVSQSLQVAPGMESSYQKIAVPSTSINQLIEKYQVGQKIALVKMDIEAAEPLALRRAEHIFDPAALPLFIVEVYELGLRRLGFTPKDIYSFFPLSQFDLYQINRSYPNPFVEFKYGNIYPLYDPEHHNWGWHTNLVAVPKVGKYACRQQLIQKHLL